jgi:DNA-binding GntR family transcriptional regulator
MIESSFLSRTRASVRASAPVRIGETVANADDSGEGSGRRMKRAPGYVDEAFSIIRADIMSLKIPPDTRISIDNLARELGVSQTPIREALSMLEAIGLVTKRHFVGYCSAPQLNRAQLDELYEVRLLIEPFAARCAAIRMSDEQRAEVSALARAMAPGETRHSYDMFADQDSELHDLIAGGSHNALIRDTLRRLHSHLHIFRLRFHSKVATEAVTEHAKLIAALLDRDEAAADAAMREHIERSYARVSPFAPA